MSWLKRAGILPWVLLAIVLGILCGQFFNDPIAKIFVTFNSVFSQLLNFSIPLIIVGLVIPAIADLGRGAGKWLGITAGIAYTSTVIVRVPDVLYVQGPLSSHPQRWRF